MDTNRLNQGEMIAAVSAIALLLIMFIFKWFGVDVGGAFGGVSLSASVNAWEAFGFIDIILFITVLVAVGGAVMTANAQSVNMPVAISALTAGLGILSVLLILYRIIDPPGPGGVGGVDVGLRAGVFLGLIAAGGIAYGGWTAMKAEGTSFSEQGDRLQNRGGGGSPPASGGGTPPPSA